MMLRVVCVSVVVLPLLSVTSALADFIDKPQPIGAGEVLIQYETSRPTEAQIRTCERIGGEITRLNNGVYVCVRRST